jgi:hypothetical protein
MKRYIQASKELPEKVYVKQKGNNLVFVKTDMTDNHNGQTGFYYDMADDSRAIRYDDNGYYVTLMGFYIYPNGEVGIYEGDDGTKYRHFGSLSSNTVYVTSELADQFAG